jgi:tRNA-dihydrouridine synthase A
MRGAVSIPVSVKNRIAIDDLPARETLFTFVDKVSAAGCSVFTVHARAAWLKGLSPKENREVPPLDYALVHLLKRAFPAQPMAINGGIATLAEGREQLAIMDGIMVGRAAYQNPEMLLGVDPELFGEPAPVTDSFEALAAFRPYVAAQLAKGVRLHSITKHVDVGLGTGRQQTGAVDGWERRK